MSSLWPNYYFFLLPQKSLYFMNRYGFIREVRLKYKVRGIFVLPHFLDFSNIESCFSCFNDFHFVPLSFSTFLPIEKERYLEITMKYLDIPSSHVLEYFHNNFLPPSLFTSNMYKLITYIYYSRYTKVYGDRWEFWCWPSLQKGKVSFHCCWSQLGRGLSLIKLVMRKVIGTKFSRRIISA